MKKSLHASFSRTSTLMLKISSFVFIAAACYHLLAIFIALNNSAGWRNLLFVLINLWCAFEIRKPKRYFIFLFSILFAQQLISHGSSVIRNYHDYHTDWLGISTLIFITLTYIALIISAVVKPHLVEQNSANGASTGT